MKTALIRNGMVIILLVVGVLSTQTQSQGQTQKSRLLIMADMGNEPDEEQQMIHMLMYSNMFDLEGLIACSGLYLNSDIEKDKFRQKVHPELFTKLITAYGKVRPNLQKHANEWPSEDFLHSIVRSGSNEFGIAGVGIGKSNEGSKLVEAAILRRDPRELYIVANAGTNSLAQALVDLDATHSDSQMKEYCERIIVFENGAQDNAGAWIMNRYPHIKWYRSNHQTYCYGGPDYGKFGQSLGPYTWKPHERNSDGQDDWAGEHIKKGHGALGALYPYRNRFIEGGGTTPWMGLAFPGLSNPNKLYWGGQSGRFSRQRQKNVYSRHPKIRRDEKDFGDFYMFKSDSEIESWTDPVDNETYSGKEVAVWRFRRSMFNDFRARMDWCVKEFAEANHNPVAFVNGDGSDSIVQIKAKPGDVVELNAAGTYDPDDDAFRIAWWIYKEAGTAEETVQLGNNSSNTTSLVVPKNSSGREIHVILEVQDRNEIVPLYDYRRIVIQCNGS